MSPGPAAIRTRRYIGGSASVMNPATRRIDGGATFTCIAENSAGHFTVPPEVLTLLPPTTVVAGTPNGSLLVIHTITAKFDAPGVGESLFVFTSGKTRIVEYK